MIFGHVINLENSVISRPSRVKNQISLSYLGTSKNGPDQKQCHPVTKQIIIQADKKKYR